MRPLIGVAARRATKSSVLRFSGSIAAEAVCDAVLRAGGEPAIVHGGETAERGRPNPRDAPPCACPAAG